MALTSGSKILISDISTALDGKIDTAGTGLSKSGTTLALAFIHSASGTLGASENSTLGFGGPFTMPYITYDEYGRVTGGGVRTMTMPAKPSAGTATAVSNVAVANQSTGNWSIPSGGSWKYFAYGYDANTSESTFKAGTVAGGSTVSKIFKGIAVRYS